jgi:thiol-disulfide isomerase/thioredoxin
MQKIVVFILFLFGTNLQAQTSAVVYGAIENANQEALTLVKNTYYFEKNAEVYSTGIKENHYLFRIPMDRSRILNFVFKNKKISLFLEPGDSLNISFEGNTFPGSVRCAGNNAYNNNFFLKFNENFKTELDKNTLETRIKSSAVDAFEMGIFNEKKKENDFYNAAADKERFSTGFKSFMQQLIRYNYLSALLAYPIVNANNNKGLTVTPLPAIMLENFDKNTTCNDSALLADSYRSFLKYFVTYFVSEANGFNKFTDLAVSMQKKYYFANQYLKNESFSYYLARLLYDECERTDAEAVKKIYNVLAWADNKGGYSKIVKEHCTKFMEAKTATDAGSMPTIKLKDLKGKEHMLTDFKGKVVYVDFWASWCGPCRQQFPYAKELKGQLTEKEKKQIEFVYVSIDNTDDVWKKGIEANGLEGTQLFSPGGWSSEVVKYFKINGIPRYMLLDKKGNIADPNAKRPSDPQILEDLRKLMQ